MIRVALLFIVGALILPVLLLCIHFFGVTAVIIAVVCTMFGLAFVYIGSDF